MSHWRCAHEPELVPLTHSCPVHDCARPCVIADCNCGTALLCDYCGAIAYKRDPFGGRPCCLICFDLMVGI